MMEALRNAIIGISIGIGAPLLAVSIAIWLASNGPNVRGKRKP